MLPEISKIVRILSSFLGEPKNEISSDYQLEFGCPNCISKYGEQEHDKYNLGVNIRKGLFHCWKCDSEGDDMHGSITKLIKIYGNEKALKNYRDAIKELKESELYKISFTSEDFNIDFKQKEKEELEFPKTFRRFKRTGRFNPKALQYLFSRGITWDIIEDFKIGYTTYDSENKIISNRIVIPSYDEFGDLNYWTGRDFTGFKKQKYFNPKVERKSIIFNEEKIQWDADITLVEGPFDHLVVPNSIPLLGKVISPHFDLYWKLMSKANAKINIFLDGDAFSTVVENYKVLNHNDLYNRIRYIPVQKELDPSEIYQKWGAKGIAQYLAHPTQINEVYLV